MTDEVINQRETDAGLPSTVNYRYADHVGDELFVAGQVPHDGDRHIVGPGNASLQTTACLDNLHTLIELHEFALAHLRHLTVYVVGDRSALAESWSAVETWFANDVPPATRLGVHLLGHKGQLVEIDARIRR